MVKELTVGKIEFYPDKRSSTEDTYQAMKELEECLFCYMRKHLNDTERFIINHTFGLPRSLQENTKWQRYNTLNRKQMSEILNRKGVKVTPTKLVGIRKKAMAKIYKEIAKYL